MNKDNREIAGLVGTIVVHIFIVLLSFFVYVRQPAEQEEGGVPVMMGDVNTSKGTFTPATMTEVDILPENSAPQTNEPETPEQEILTQDEEPTIAIPKKKETPKKPKSKPEEPKKPKEKTEAEKKAEAEKAAAEKAAKSIAGAFGKGSKMANKGSGNTENGIEGSKDGNATSGKSTDVGKYGTFDLNGRSLGEGGLPRPVYYNVKDEGTVVVNIIVDPSGKVVGTSIDINKQTTNTTNAKLRDAAEEAAKRARFNSVEGINNQTGTITYYFKLK